MNSDQWEELRNFTCNTVDTLGTFIGHGRLTRTWTRSGRLSAGLFLSSSPNILTVPSYPVVSISDNLEANGLMNILLVILGWPVLYSSSFSVAHCDPYMYTVGAKSIPRLRECQNWTKLEPLSNLMISVCRWGTWGAEQGSNLSEVTILTEVGWLCSNSMSPAFS